MRKIICWLLLVASGLSVEAQSPVKLLTSRCLTVSPMLILWTGAQVECVALPSNISYSGGVLTIIAPAAPPPLWNVETISLANVASGATSTSYTTLKTPINGTVFYFYYSTNFFLSTSGVVPYTGPPMTITLPTGWLSSDSIAVVYQSQ